MSVNQQTHQPPRRRHLMDPNAPRRAPDPEAIKRLERVQRIVISALVFTTILHLAVGLVIAADHVDNDRLDAQIGLIVLGTASMVIGVAAVLAIQRRRVLSPWLLTGLLPGVVGAWWVLLR
jgi:hypothetical protein